MAENSPITGVDLGPISSGLLACDHLAELSATREKFQTFLEWMLQDGGELSTDFINALLHQILFDAAKKNWFVRSNPSTGYLELVQYVPRASIDPTGAVEGDTLVLEGGVWVAQSSPTVYLAPTTGGPNPPDADVGGLSSVAHGLGATPSHFQVFLECTATDCGYAVGDKVDALSLIFENPVAPELAQGTTVFANATIVGVIFRNGAATCDYQLLNKSTFVRADIDITKWAVRFQASL